MHDDEWFLINMEGKGREVCPVLFSAVLRCVREQRFVLDTLQGSDGRSHAFFGLRLQW